MMMNSEVVINGIVIKQVPYGENDAIITCLCENGIVTFKARGVLKPSSKNMSSCLMYAYSEFTLEQKKSNNYLTKAKLISSNYKLYENLEYMTCLGLISECINTFLDEKVSKLIYDSFHLLLKGINDGFDIYTLTLINLAKIVKESGYGIDVNSCIRCGGKKSIVSINLNEGGFICKKCCTAQDEVKSTTYLKTVRYVFNVDLDNYYHYVLDKKVTIKLIREYVFYLQECFGYKKLKFFELFEQIVEM